LRFTVLFETELLGQHRFDFFNELLAAEGDAGTKIREGVRCAHGGQPPEYERSVLYIQNVMPSIPSPQNRSKSHPDQAKTGLEITDFERKMALSEFVIRLGRG